MPSPAPPQTCEATPGTTRRWWVLDSVEVGNFVVYMDAFIVTLALPAIARDFGVGIQEVKWVMLSYLVALTSTLLLSGRLADRFGRKTIASIGMGTLAIGAGLCIFAPTFFALLACRILQGVGGALVLANVMAEITSAFVRTERRKAMAINSSILALGQVVGLLLGGALIGALGWRSIFAFIAMLTFLGFAMDLGILRNQPRSSSSKIDLPGALLSVLVVGIPLLLIERLSARANQPLEFLLFTASAVLLAAFVAVESKHPAPILDMRLFRLRAFVCGSLAACFYFVAAGSAYFLVPLYAQTVMGLSPFHAGLLMTPLAIALVVISQLVGKFSHKFPARVIATFGLLCTSGAVLGLSQLGSHGSPWLIVALLILVGAGGGLFHPPNNTSVLAEVPPGMLGSANGFFTMARSFGQALGVAIGAAILAAGIAKSGAESFLSHSHAVQAGPPALAAYAASQDLALRVAAAFGLAGAILSAFRGPPITTPPPADLNQK